MNPKIGWSVLGERLLLKRSPTSTKCPFNERLLTIFSDLRSHKYDEKPHSFWGNFLIEIKNTIFCHFHLRGAGILLFQVHTISEPKKTFLNRTDDYTSTTGEVDVQLKRLPDYHQSRKIVFEETA